ncbi:MAG: ferrous iron transport protein A [Chromatiales bacterium]|nr:ferrous iron transport protein A [Chromatiales bacterium]
MPRPIVPSRIDPCLRPQICSVSPIFQTTPRRDSPNFGGRQLTRRLLALGLRQGSPLSIVQRRSKGLVLASGELRIAIGTGIAEKLWVMLESDPAVSEVQARSGDEAA